MGRGVEAPLLLLCQGCFLMARGQEVLVGLAQVLLVGVLEKDEHNSACYLLRRVLSLASTSWSLCLLFPSDTQGFHQKGKAGGVKKGRQLFILESSYLLTSISGNSNLPEEAAVHDLGIQQQSAS